MLPYFDFDLDRVTRDYRGVNPNAPLYQVSSRSGDGMADYAANFVRDFEKVPLPAQK